jgi:sulfoxide reductase heme-binding subunit YedZ
VPSGPGHRLGRRVRGWTVGILVLGLLPLVLTGADAALGRLGANPIEAILHRFGWWSLTLLVASLAFSPVRYLTGRHGIIRYRRLIGLLSFLYATLHLLTYAVLDRWLVWDLLAEDLVERPFITAGFASWFLLLLLAATSSQRAIRKLGARWRLLHSWAYVAAALGTLHFFWKERADSREPLIFALALICLLLLRLPSFRDRRQRRSRIR